MRDETKGKLLRVTGAAAGGFGSFLASEFFIENEWGQALAAVVGTIVTAYALSQISITKEEKAIRALLTGDDF